MEPEMRFVEVTEYFKEACLEVMDLYEEVISEAIGYMFKFLDMITFSRNNEKYQEMEGIAKALDRQTNEVMMLNYLYELDAYCTSIVAKSTNNSIIFARNLDFYFANETRKILYIAKYYRGEQYLFEAPMFAGIVGVYTGYKPNGFALAINERNPKSSDSGFLQNLGMLFSGFS